MFHQSILIRADCEYAPERQKASSCVQPVVCVRSIEFQKPQKEAKHSLQYTDPSVADFFKHTNQFLGAKTIPAPQHSSPKDRFSPTANDETRTKPRRIKPGATLTPFNIPSSPVQRILGSLACVTALTRI